MREMAQLNKIVWFTWKLNQAGGGERLLLEGVRYFETKGIETHIVTCDFDEVALFGGTYQPKITVLREKRKQINLDVAMHKWTNSILSYGLYWLRMVLALRRKIKEISPDIIITQTYVGDSFSLYFATLFTHFQYITFVHGTMFRIPDDLTKYSLTFRRHLIKIRESVTGYRENIPLHPPKTSWPRRLLAELVALACYLAVKKAKVVIVPSQQVQWEVKLLYNKDAVILKGAFPARIFEYKPKQNIRGKFDIDKGKMALSVSRLVAKKRVDLCIEAFKRAETTVKDAILVIGGEGPEELKLKELVKQLGLESRVKFVGFIPEEELWDYYAGADVFLNLDIADFDVSAYEGLALSRSVVWSNEMEIDDVLKDRDFIFATAPSTDEAAKNLIRALSLQTIANRDDRRALLYSYTWEVYFERVSQYIEIARA